MERQLRKSRQTYNFNMFGMSFLIFDTFFQETTKKLKEVYAQEYGGWKITFWRVAQIEQQFISNYNLTNMQECISSRKNQFDRYIPHRVSTKLTAQRPTEPMIEQNLHPYQRLLSREIFNEPMVDESSQPLAQNYCMSTVKHFLSKKSEIVQKRVSKRQIHLSPEKVLDAPEIRDDYYLNLLDWSSKGQLAIGLGEKVYLYTPASIRELTQKEDEYICSLSFNPQGDHLAVGLSEGRVQIYDVEREVLVRSLRGHTNRVSSSAFTYGMLFTGSKDTKIIGHDYRAHQNVVTKFQGHRGQVCGLKHDPCGLASGSNDNTALIWDLNAGKVRYTLQGHKAAVKALAWCPWQRNLLATGGGTSDQTMRFWNIETGKLINTVHTESQVCSLIWNKKDKQILSSHGFSENQLSLWKYPSCTKVADLKGHSQRVLHMSMAPDNTTICTASADQTLRFWKVFDNNGDKEFQKCGSLLTTKSCSLR